MIKRLDVITSFRKLSSQQLQAKIKGLKHKRTREQCSMETIQVEMQLRANGVTMFLIKKEYKIGVQSCLTKVDKNHVHY